MDLVPGRSRPEELVARRARPADSVGLRRPARIQNDLGSALIVRRALRYAGASAKAIAVLMISGSSIGHEAHRFPITTASIGSLLAAVTDAR